MKKNFGVSMKMGRSVLRVQIFVHLMCNNIL